MHITLILTIYLPNFKLLLSYVKDRCNKCIIYLFKMFKVDKNGDGEKKGLD